MAWTPFVNPRTPLDGAVFDLDGVLVDSLDAWLHAEQTAVGRLGGRWRRSRPFPPGLDPGASLAERCGLGGQEAELNAEVEAAFLTLVSRAVRPIEREVEAVRRIAHCVPVAIATNTTRPLAEALVARTGLGLEVTALVCPDGELRRKPAPDLYRAACARLECSPSVCLGVDDTYDGVSAAVRAGLVTVAFGEKGGAVPGVHGVIGHLDQLLTC